jgi:hypothetical protein
MGNDGALALAAALATNTHLVVLMVDSNDMTGRGCAALCASLAHHPRLTHFYLSYNRIGDEGATALAELLSLSTKSNSTSKSIHQLQVLKVSHNEIGPRGAAALADALRKTSNNSRITTLEARYNAWGCAGVTAVLDALGDDNHTLRTLDVRNNQISSTHPPLQQAYDAPIRQAAIRMLRRNATLSHLYLWDETPHEQKVPLQLMEDTTSGTEQATLAFLLAWNRAGRQSLLSTDNHTAIPMAYLLANGARDNNPSVLFASLRTRPDVALAVASVESSSYLDPTVAS